MKDHEYKSPFVRRVAFYCQKVLPLVFDNSLSYYEALAHFAHKLNETIDGLNKQSMQIMEFEKELALALDTFENELRQTQTNFETRIETEWSNFRADISRWQSNLEGDWEVMKSELETVEQLIQEKQLELEADYTQYKADLTAQQTAFETAQTTRQQNFETAQTNRQQTFENSQTTRQTNFENAQTARQDAFEEEISEQIEDVTHVRQLAYMGAYSPTETDPETISSIASSPLDIGDMIVRVYHKSYLGDSFDFIKRMPYANIENDSDIPEWYDRGDSYAIVFENPIINEWIKSGITIYNHASTFFFQQTPRLVIRKFNTINNEQLALSDSVLQATYTWPGTAQQVGEVLQLRQVEAPMTATPPYYYTAFIFYNGMGLHIDLINQPANSTTKVFTGYSYDAYRGGILRDPKITEMENRIDNIGGQVESVPQITTLETTDTAETIDILTYTSTINSNLTNFVRVYHCSDIAANPPVVSFVKRVKFSQYATDSSIPNANGEFERNILIFENPSLCAILAANGQAFGFSGRRTDTTTAGNIQAGIIQKIPVIDANITENNFNFEMDFFQQFTYPTTGSETATLSGDFRNITTGGFLVLFVTNIHNDVKFRSNVANVTLTVKGGYEYNPINNKLVRDPTVINFRDNVNAVAFGGGNELSANTDLHDLTPGRYFVGQTNAGTIANRPENLSLGFNVECSSIFDRSSNRLKLRLYYNSPSTIGTFYECYLTSSGWSSWYKFTGTAVT